MKEFTNFIQSRIPRILTHLDRDKDSPTFGCFDRNYWHYKICDFSSAILQQSCYGLDLLPGFINIRPKLAEEWLGGALNFWAQLPTRGGGFNEYYPYEASYPATAFSLQAVTKVLFKRKSLINSGIKKQIEKSLRFLLNNFEAQASNQQAAGLAAISQAKVLGFQVKKNKFKEIKKRLFTLQSKEGWFPEYGGPDLGYLSVTLDMLYDYYEVSGDNQALEAMGKAVDFLGCFVGKDGSLLTIANSRETDYIVPYGLVRLGKTYSKAASIFQRVFSKVNEPEHFLQSIDDRYNLHYIFNSCARAHKYVAELRESKAATKKIKKYFPEAQIYVKKDNKNMFVIAGNKGGSMQIQGKRPWQDYGWRCRQGEKIWVSHFLAGQYEAGFQDNVLSVSGYMIPVKWLVLSLFRRICLFLASFIFTHKIIRFLKREVILKKTDNKFYFERRVDLLNKTMYTKIRGLGMFTAFRAPKQPTRYVASAYSYSPLEIIPRDIKKKDCLNTMFIKEKLPL